MMRLHSEVSLETSLPEKFNASGTFKQQVTSIKTGVLSILYFYELGMTFLNSWCLWYLMMMMMMTTYFVCHPHEFTRNLLILSYKSYYWRIWPSLFSCELRYKVLTHSIDLHCRFSYAPNGYFYRRTWTSPQCVWRNFQQVDGWW